MSTTEAGPRPDTYALGRTPQEYERLRAQARMWEAPTGRLLDQIGLAPGATCLDAGCGPGETMRLMAHRVGPAGRVTGIDADAALVTMTRAMLDEAGHGQCAVRVHEIGGDTPVPGGPYDLVYARLLLFHLPARVAVLRRLWEAVAPGGHLVMQDYDLNSASVLPAPDSVTEVVRVLNAAFGVVGCDVRAGTRLPQLLAEAGVGAPDGTDVAGYLEPFSAGRVMLEQTYRSLLPVALAHGITTGPQAETTLADLDRDAAQFADAPMLWPLLIGAWKRKGGEELQ